MCQVLAKLQVELRVSWLHGIPT